VPAPFTVLDLACRSSGRADLVAAGKEIKVRRIGNCLKADPAYGEGVAKALDIPMSEVQKNG